jgi:SdpI/YfhL protein family
MHPHDQTTVAAVILGAGVLVFCVSLPLIYRKIPMNIFYGVRIAEAFQSERRWYDINAYGGRLFAGWSWLTIIAGAFGFFVPAEIFSAYIEIAVGLLLASLLFLVVWTIQWARANR